ncbi:TetR family transcriptional regulator C-terminal domain-containing protein [Streptomyces sp. S1A(2023)]
MTRQARTGPGDGLERLSRLVRSVLDMVVAEPELARILVDLWAAGRQGGALGVDISAVYREYRAVIAELLADAEAEGVCRAGVGAGHAVVVVGAIEGCLVQWIVDPTLPVAELTAPLLDVCVEGLRRGGAE